MKNLILVFLMIFIATGCAVQRMPLPEPPPEVDQKKDRDLKYVDSRKYSYRTRKPVRVRQNRYEGSLWEDEASWGNLLRDHRARFRGDVVTITKIQDILNIPAPEPKQQVQQPLVPAGEEEAAQANQALAAMEEAMGISKIEEQRNDVLRSIRSITAKVTKVLPNGNMIVVGEKVDYRDQNNVKYVTRIVGTVRPEDVSPENEVTAVKLAMAEVNTKRKIKSSTLNLKALAPILGKQKADALDKASNISGGKK